MEIGSKIMGASMENPLDCGWGRIEVGEFSKPHDLSVSNVYFGTNVGARSRVSSTMVFVGGRDSGTVCFDFNRPLSVTKWVVAEEQLNSFELRSLSQRHKSEGVRCSRGPLATVGVASTATANTIAVTRIVRRAVAVGILSGAGLNYINELF